MATNTGHLAHLSLTPRRSGWLVTQNRPTRFHRSLFNWVAAIDCRGKGGVKY